MRYRLFLLVLTISATGCSHRDKENEFSFVKVFVINSADSMTAYNKDLGIASYVYYDFEKDSIIYRSVIGFDPNRYETYVGHLNDKRYVDTFYSLLRALKKFRNGIITDSLPVDAVYCGPEFYVEYADDKGEHYNSFILSTNDTLDLFADFYFRLDTYPWKKRLVSNSLVKVDTEVVAAYKKLRVYDQVETPYIPVTCDSGIDFSKITGEWRLVSSAHEKLHTYWKITYRRDGTYLFEKIRKSEVRSIASGNYQVDAKTNMFIIKTNNGTLRYKLTRVTENCLEYNREGREDDVTRLDRLSSQER